MPNNADDLRDANPWHPITNTVDLKHLGKLAEELNECGSAVARCIIQGVDECEPVTGIVNRNWLENEIADVLANIILVRQRFSLDAAKIEKRIEKKCRHLRQWHSLA